MNIDIDSKEYNFLGDINIDQMLRGNTMLFYVLWVYCQLLQCYKNTTHNKGGTLNLVFNNNTNAPGAPHGVRPVRFAPYQIFL